MARVVGIAYGIAAVLAVPYLAYALTSQPPRPARITGMDLASLVIPRPGRAFGISWLTKAAAGPDAISAACYVGIPLLVLAISGIASGAALLFKRPGDALSAVPLFGRLALFAGTVGALAAPVSLLRLFLSFLKIGSVVFGSGYVLLAFLRAEFVSHLHWLTEKQLIDAVAVGQFTPGPVFTTATFIGYLVAGIPGAVVATVGVFVPGFVFVALSGRMIPKLRRSPLAAAILDGVVVGSLALMAVVAWQLGRAAIVDWITLSIAVVSAGLLLRFRINSAWLIGGAAVIGWLVRA